MSLAKLIRGILSYSVPPILFPSAIACDYLAIGFDEYTLRSLTIYYLIGLAWLAISVGLARAIRPRVKAFSPALSLVVVASSLLGVVGLIAWNWADQTPDYHSGVAGCLLTISATAGMGIIAAAIHAIIAQIPFRADHQ